MNSGPIEYPLIPLNRLSTLLHLVQAFRMRLSILAVLVALHFGGLQGQAQSSDSAAVVQTLERFQAAFKAGDSAAVLRLLAPDAVVLEGGGIETLMEFRSHHLAADIRFAQSSERKPGPVHVRVAGSTAWAWSTAESVGTGQGQAVTSVGAELAVLTRTTLGWQIQAIHWSSRRRRP